MPFLYQPKTKTGDLIKFPQIFTSVLIGNGCWPTDGDVNDFWFQFKAKLYDLYGWVVYLNMTFIVFCEMAYLISNMMDILKAAESFCPTIIGLFMVFRTLYFRLVMNRLKKLIINFANDIWIDGEKNTRRIKRCHRVMAPAFVYFILLFLVLSLYAIIPMYVFFTTNQTINSTDKRTPYSMIFPYDVQKTSYYVLTYASAVIAGYVIISNLYAHDALLLLLVSYTCGQFEILHGDIVRLIPECHAKWQQLCGVSRGDGVGGGAAVSVGDVQPDAGQIKLLQDMYTKCLHELSARHRNLISFCVQVNDLISLPLLMNIVISTFLICFCGFQFLISGTSSLGYFMLFSSFFLSLALQLFMICSCGAMLITHSVDTTFYLYMCNWEGGQLSNFSPLLLKPKDMDASLLDTKLPLWRNIKYYPTGKDFRNKLRFMIMRSQRPVELSAMKFSVLSLECYSKILSSSMSYFALLKTFLDKQK